MAAVSTPAIGAASFSEGQICVYENDSAAILAVVRSSSPQGVAVLNQFGAQLSLPPIRLHKLLGNFKLSAERAEERAAELRSLLSDATERAAAVSLADLWSLLVDDGRKLELKDLAETAFGRIETASYLGLFLKLAKDKVYFRRTGFAFEPRNRDSVEQLHRAELAAQARHDQLLKIIQEIQSAIAQRGTGLMNLELLHGSSGVSAALQLLARVACESPHIPPQQQKEVREIIERLTDAPELVAVLGKRDRNKRESDTVMAYRLLDALGLFDARTNPTIYRHRWVFDAEAGIGELEGAPEKNLQRRDLRDLYCFTIDDLTTHDMDDALSVSWSDESITIGVHISDVTAIVPVGSKVEAIARARATSIYLPERVYNMLPAQLAADRASLREGETRDVISCLFQFSRSHELQSTEIVAARIKSRAKITYDQVDRLLEGDITLRDLEWAAAVETISQIAARNEDRRLRAGAQKVGKRDLHIDVDERGLVNLREFDEQSPARTVVSEMAVMANEAFAKFAQDNNLPFLYRSQPAGEATAAEDLPEGPARAYAERSNLKRSVVSVQPAPHSSLGLAVYAQVTSPIRRFADLCNQRQLVAHLAGESPVYSKEELSQIMESLEEPLGGANTISRDSRRYWLLRYIEQLCDHGTQELAGVVLRTDLKNPLVELVEIPFTTLVRANPALKPGDRVQLKILKVDAWGDQLKLEPHLASE